LPKGISVPARRALAHEGLETLEQIAELGEERVAGLHGMGPKTMAQLQDAMEDAGISFPS